MDAFSLQSTLVYRADGVEHLAHVFCLSHRCQITSGKSVRAIFPCAAGAAIAAEATRAAASAASSEDSRNSHKILIYYAYWLFLKDFLRSIYCAIHILHNFEEMWIMKQHRNRRASLLYLFYTFQPFCEFLLKRKSDVDISFIGKSWYLALNKEYKLKAAAKMFSVIFMEMFIYNS